MSSCFYNHLQRMMLAGMSGGGRAALSEIATPKLLSSSRACPNGPVQGEAPRFQVGTSLTLRTAFG